MEDHDSTFLGSVPVYVIRTNFAPIQMFVCFIYLIYFALFKLSLLMLALELP